MSFTLNKEQADAAQKIAAFLGNPATKGTYFTLTGGPGTGKTFMLKDALKGYKSTIYGGTVSHAAKNVLQESLGSDIPCFTIAQLLGMRMNIKDDGTVNFAPSHKIRKAIRDAKIVVLDEVSMIDDDIFKIIIDEIVDNDIRLIAVGDKYQLPPVEQEHDSKFFDTIDAELTRPMRFTGAIQTLSQLFRTQIKSSNTGGPFDKYVLNNKTQRKSDIDRDNHGYEFTNDIYKVVDEAANDIKSNPADMNYARVLAFKNESVRVLNNAIRSKIYGDELGQFEWNEIVICNGGYTYSSTDVYGSTKKIPILYNGQIMRVEGWRDAEHSPYDIPCLEMKFKNFDSPAQSPIFVIKNEESAMIKYHNIKHDLEQRAKRDPKQWVRFYSFLDKFASFDYCYAQNLYKAQGATLNNVYVCEGEVMGIKPLNWKQKFQALYVATTRAKQKLIIYNKDF